MRKKNFVLAVLLFGLFYTLSSPAPAQAAALAVKGEVPSLPPVQPKPQGTLPNYQNNINTPPEGQAPAQEASQPVEESQPARTGPGAEGQGSGNGLMGLLAIIFSVAAVVGGILFLLRSDKSQVKD